jgi:hypothetical protein
MSSSPNSFLGEKEDKFSEIWKKPTKISTRLSMNSLRNASIMFLLNFSIRLLIKKSLTKLSVYMKTPILLRLRKNKMPAKGSRLIVSMQSK